MNMRSRIIERIQISGQRPAPTLKGPVRQLVHKATGGDSAGSQLLRGLCWKFRPFLVISVIANVLAALFEGGTMAIFTGALDLVAGNANTVTGFEILAPVFSSIEQRFGANSIFPTLILVAVIMQISRSWLDFAARSSAAVFRSWSEGDLRRRLFHHFTSLSYEEVSRHKVGDLSSLVSEVDRIGNLATFANHLVGHLSIAAAYAMVLLWISWELTLISVVALILLSMSLRVIRTGVRKRAKRFLSAYVKLNERIVEFLSGMRLLHTFDRQSWARMSVDSTINESIRSRRQAMILSATVPAIVQTITVVGVATFLGLGYVYILRSGDTSVATRLVTFVFIVYRMLPRVTGINASLAKINQEFPFAARLAEHLSSKRTSTQHTTKSKTLRLQDNIQFENVSFQYADTRAPALNHMQLTVPKGIMLAIVGESGSGKSSVVSLLMRLYTPSAGQILVDGVPLQSIDKSTWLGKVGIVDQDSFMLHESIRENIRFGRFEASDGEVQTAAKLANAHEFISSLTNGYDTIVGDRGYRLSGGQKQRIAIARAILRQPEVLILDEATSALDSHSEKLIQDAIDSIRSTCTLIVIAHRLSTIARADNIVVLHKGSVVESGSHDRLLAAKGRYHSLWLLQQGLA